MLQSNKRGYAVMNKELTGISLEGESVDELKRYCRCDDVIAERVPFKNGIVFQIMFAKFYKPFGFKSSMKNIFWAHWYLYFHYSHKTGKIVYKNPTTDENIL